LEPGRRDGKPARAIDVENLLATDTTHYQIHSAWFVADGAVQPFPQLAELQYSTHLALGLAPDQKCRHQGSRQQRWSNSTSLHALSQPEP
jgi:hypothetical protein